MAYVNREGDNIYMGGKNVLRYARSCLQSSLREHHTDSNICTLYVSLTETGKCFIQVCVYMEELIVPYTVAASDR